MLPENNPGLIINVCLPYDPLYIYNIMKDDKKTKAQLLEEISILRGRVKELEKYVESHMGASEELKRHKKNLEDMVNERTGGIMAINELLKNEIEERKHAEQAVTEQARFLQHLMDSLPIPVFYKDTKGVYRGCNASFETFLGKKGDEIIGRSVHDMYPDELADKYFEKDSELLEKGGIQTYEYSATHADGTKHEVLFNKAAYRNSDGTVAGLIGGIIDVTELKNIRNLLKESEKRMFSIVQNMPVLMVAFDELDNIIFWNRECERVTGYTSKEILGSKNPLKMLYPDREHLENLMKKWKEKEYGFHSWDIPITSKDGTAKIVSWYNISNEVPVPGWESWAVGINITERIKSDQAFRDSEEKFRILTEQMPDGVLLVIDGKIQWANSSAERILGYSREELNSTRHENIINAEQLQKLREDFKKRLTDFNMSAQGETRAVCRDGSVKDVDIIAKKILYEGREAIQVILRDITEKKTLERDVLTISDKERLRIGQDLHDELGQYLTGIGYLVGIIKTAASENRPPEEDVLGELIELINTAKTRTRMLSKGLSPVVMDRGGIFMALNELCLELERVYSVSCNLTYDEDLALDSPVLFTNLYNIIQESMINAVKHGNPSTIFVTLKKKGNGLKISVCDDGSGFSDEDLGRGLGIFLMKYRADLIGGHLNIDNNEGGGVVVSCTVESLGNGKCGDRP